MFVQCCTVTYYIVLCSTYPVGTRRTNRVDVTAVMLYYVYVIIHDKIGEVRFERLRVRRGCVPCTDVLVVQLH